MSFVDSEAQAALLGVLVGADIAEFWLEQSQSGPESESPELMSIWIVLGDGDGVRISAAPGGTGVRISKEPPAYVDMGEWGEIAVAPAAGRHGLRPGRISQIWRIDAPYVTSGDRLAGVRWQQVDGADVAVFHDDDCFFIGPFDDVAKDPTVARHEPRLVPILH